MNLKLFDCYFFSDCQFCQKLIIKLLSKVIKIIKVEFKSSTSDKLVCSYSFPLLYIPLVLLLQSLRKITYGCQKNGFWTFLLPAVTYLDSLILIIIFFFFLICLRVILIFFVITFFNDIKILRKQYYIKVFIKMKQKIKRVNYFTTRQSQDNFSAKDQGHSNNIGDQKKQIALEYYDSYFTQQYHYKNSFKTEQQAGYSNLNPSKQQKQKTNFKKLSQNLQLFCPCCMQPYNLQSRSPLSICVEQHCVCKMCYQHGSFFREQVDNFECYICKQKTNKLSVRPHRIIRNIIENFSLLNQLESKNNCGERKSSIYKSPQIKQQFIRKRQFRNQNNRCKSLSEIRATIPCKFQLKCRYFKKGICRYFHEERRRSFNDYAPNRKYHHSLPKKNQSKFY